MSFHAVDFGTSNSLLSYVSLEGKITPVPLDINSHIVLRSLLYAPEKNIWFFGQEAVNEYVARDGEGRFFRSIKKFLPEPSYSGTSVFNRNMSIVDLVGVFLKEMRERANRFTGIQTNKIVLGRPALYSLDLVQDKLAQDRMEAAAVLAGYEEVIFCPEPIAAGLDYSSAPFEEKIVLIADFGGGTSDFTLMKTGQGNYNQENILGISGIFKAGDALDSDLMRDFIAPYFGSSFEYQFPGSSNILKFPRSLLKKICSPAHITHLREKDTWEFLQHINKFALSSDDKKKMENLFNLVECQLGFPLFNEIEKTKIKLTNESSVDFQYHQFGIEIQQTISHHSFNESVTPTVSEIMETMMEVFLQSGLSPKDVDQVVLTGGTSQFPLIQMGLENTFGKSKMSEHDIYHSVVNGLARFAAQSSN
jgi:hypothetical chaperone protein